MAPKLTIGMACFEDFAGVWPTVQSLRMQFGPLLRQLEAELIIVDNNPTGRDAKMLQDFRGWIHGDFKSARYIPLLHPVGTAAPRDMVFREAVGEWVLCIDSHILLFAEALPSLVSYMAAHPRSSDLLAGPMVYDDLFNYSDHFRDIWHTEMWGRWGTAWHCPCQGFAFNYQITPQPPAHYDQHTVTTLPPGTPYLQIFPITGKTLEPIVGGCPSCGREFPLQCEQAPGCLLERGFTPTATWPYEIGAMGLGLFACRKAAWLGFNQRFAGFGGEEWYIHHKFRKAGQRCWCLPSLRWLHRFRDMRFPAPYPLLTWQRVRNYVLAHHELGLPMDRLYQHFVRNINEEDFTPIRKNADGSPAAGPMTEADWRILIEDPSNPPERQPAKQTTCGGCSYQAPQSLEIWYQRAHQQTSDFNEHVPTLRQLASVADSVVELGGRRGVSTVSLLAGQPRQLFAFDAQVTGEVNGLLQLRGKTDFRFFVGDSRTVPIPEADLIFIDTRHTAEYLQAELNNVYPKAKRRIALHDTVIFGETGEDKSAGLLVALRAFVKEHPEWSVIRHDRNNNGFTVLSKDPRDKKSLPNTVTMAWNYARALTTHILTGRKVVGLDVVRDRLDICGLCDQRTDNRCAACGCYLDQGPNGEEGKAVYAESECPLGKWHAVPDPAAG
jgi:hypothetical protein